MVTTEPEINTALGELLQGMKSDWNVLAEQTRQLKSSAGKRVDVLIEGFGGTVIAIETEFLPAQNVEEEAQSRLGEKLKVRAGTIDTAMAVKVPEILKNYAGAILKKEISQVNNFQYAVYTTKNEAARSLDFEQTEKKRKGEGYIDRFPQEGWLTGSLQDLAVLAQGYTIPPDAIVEAADIIQYAVHEADAVMNREFGDTSVKREKLAQQLLQRKDEKNKRNPYQQIYRMVGIIFLNAIIFQNALSKEYDIKEFNEFSTPKHGVFINDIIDEWYKILKINYHPIFIIAVNILRMLPSSISFKVLPVLYKASEKIVALGVERTPGLFGIVFQKLISDRKFLATFYTRPDAAVLLAHLAISEEKFLGGKGWEEAEAIKALKIADFSCGTGTLLSATYQRIAQLHELHGGGMPNIHHAMMERVITGLDIMPSGVHLTAASLAGFYYKVDFKDTNLYTLAFGVDKDDHITTGSLELLDPQGDLLLPPATYQMRGEEEKNKKDTSVKTLAPNEYFDLVIMNPPYTRATNHAAARAEITNPAFAAFGMSEEQQRALGDRTSKLLKKVRNVKEQQGQISAAHGNAGLGSYFFEIADLKIRHGGRLAMVLPLSFIAGESWRSARQLIAQDYHDIMIITIAQSVAEDCAFSADTSMAECLLLASKNNAQSFTEKNNEKNNKKNNGKNNDSPPNRVTSVALKARPRNTIESSEIARLVKILQKEKAVNRLEDGPIGGSLLKAGGNILGQVIEVPLDATGSCPALSIRSPEIMQTAWQLAANNRLWLPGQAQEQASSLPITTIGNLAKRGPVHRDINEINIRTKVVRGPFDIEPLDDDEPTYAALWNHKAEAERFLVVNCDRQARIRQGYDEQAHKIWKTASRVHYSCDCGFRSHSLIVGLTEKKSLGGAAWPSLYDFPSPQHEHAFSLWSNSTLGLLCHLYKSNLQHGGRGRTTITQIPSFPTLDVADKRVNLAAADTAFHKLKTRPLLPLYKADEDETRHAIDKAVLVDMLGLNPDLLAPEGALTQLRKKICNEPAIHGGKKS